MKQCFVKVNAPISKNIDKKGEYHAYFQVNASNDLTVKRFT